MLKVRLVVKVMAHQQIDEKIAQPVDDLQMVMRLCIRTGDATDQFLESRTAAPMLVHMCLTARKLRPDKDRLLALEMLLAALGKMIGGSVQRTPRRIIGDHYRQGITPLDQIPMIGVDHLHAGFDDLQPSEQRRDRERPYAIASPSASSRGEDREASRPRRMASVSADRETTADRDHASSIGHN
jgi:hypothetical protein